VTDEIAQAQQEIAAAQEGEDINAEAAEAGDEV